MNLRIHRLRELQPGGSADPGGPASIINGSIAFCTVKRHPARGTVLLGLTTQDNDLLYELDPRAGRMRSLHYQRIAEAYEIKIHRSLCVDSTGRVYGATACLHDLSHRRSAPGGKLFRYDFATESYAVLGVPCPHDYIQTITLDERRGLIYGFAFPVFSFFVWDIATGGLRFSQYMGSIPHVAALDDAGGYWATWDSEKHYLYRYDPDANEVTFFRHGLPGSVEGAGLMYPGAGPIDAMVNGGDGFLYIGETTGRLLRLDPRSAEVTTLGRPVEESRMAALEIGPDGRLWGIAGFRERCHLFAFDRAAAAFADYGHLATEGLALYIGHDLCFAGDDTIFIGETDTVGRAGYLWECEI